VTGKVAALGREYDVPTPADTFVYAALKPYVNPGNADGQRDLAVSDGRVGIRNTAK
jgi:hypothetical protein